LGFCAPFLLLVVFISSAQAFSYAIVPPGDWKWYYTLFNDAGQYVEEPTFFWGHATVTIAKSAITTKMATDEPSESDGKPPTFSGKIDTHGQVEGVLDGLLPEEDGREMVGYYHRQHWGRSCFVETLILQERYRRENVLIFRRGSTLLC
jgi:hypothetical protein